MKLNDDRFIRVIDTAPLVAIDLVLQNQDGQILLGKRRNRPAQNYWFVPGGRIRKNERSQDALQRIAQTELGISACGGRLLGVFDHFYPDNFFGVPDITTHYVTLACQVEVGSSTPLIRDEQHMELKWWDVESLLASDEVHENTKLYFSESPDNGFKCECG